MSSKTLKTSDNEESESADEEKSEENYSPQMLTCQSFQRQIRDVVFTLIPEVPRLQELYLNWESLGTLEKACVDAVSNTTHQGLELYKPVIDALKHWDNIQDCCGAPGCEPGMVTLSAHPQIETLIGNVMFALESLVAKLQGKDDDCSDHSDTYNTTRVTSSLRSLYEEDKDRGDGSDQGRKQRSLSLDDIPTLLGRKEPVFLL